MENILTGAGIERQEALRSAGRGVRRGTARDFAVGTRERVLKRIVLNDKFGHIDYVVGDAMSADEHGGVTPLTPGRPFAGLLDGLGLDSGGQHYVASLTIRGIMSASVAGLSPTSKRGDNIYAVPGLKAQTFSLEAEAGGVLIGQLLFVESLERGVGLIGVKLENDPRPFELR